MAKDVVQVSADELQLVRSALPAITRSHLFDVLGISENTWRKMRDGEPVKRSTWDRIRVRLAGQELESQR
jgi:hypothetical protein